MKQLLFLLLFPCLAMAQYQGNGNQKITLGEQTTADGLVYRGVENDTALITPSSDTSAYIILDTVNNRFYNYNRDTNVWSLAGGGVSVSSFSAGTTGLTPSTATTGEVTLGGTLAVANGGTGADMSSLPNNYLVRKNSSGVFDTSSVYEAGGKVGIGLIPDIKLHIASPIASDFLQYTENASSKVSRFGIQVTSNYEKLLFNSYNIPMYLSSGAAGGTGGIVAIQTSTTLGSEVERMRVDPSGNVGIGTASPAVQFHTTGAVRFATFAGGGTTTLDVDNTGNLARTSSIELKKDVTPINYGLNQILQINPINFNWINEDKYGNENENGFIAEDVMNVIPNVVGSDAHGLFMDYTKLIPILTKAIQEQNALIKALEQRIINLENK